MRSSAAPTSTGSLSTFRYFGEVANHKVVNYRDVSLRESLQYHTKRKDYATLAAMCDTVLRLAKSECLKMTAQFLLDDIKVNGRI